MKVDHHKAWSPNLDQEMELNVYGEAGKPILVFPTRGGRYYDYEASAWWKRAGPSSTKAASGCSPRTASISSPG